MEPKSLNQIITEEEFLPLVQDASASFFRNFNAYRVLVNETEPTRKCYSNLIQQSDFLESFLDEYGARENRTWSAFTEYIASIRNLVISGFYTKHLLDRYPYYRLRDCEEEQELFFSRGRNFLNFLNRSILNLYEEAIRAATANGLKIVGQAIDPDEFQEIEVTKQLPKNVVDDLVKEDEDRVIDLFEKVGNVNQLIADMGFQPTHDPQKLRMIVPDVLDEKKARYLMNLVHSIQSEFDTYIKNTSMEQRHKNLKDFRGYISMPLHLLEVTVWLCHFFERHEDEIRHSECKRTISSLVDKTELLGHIVNFVFERCLYYIHEGHKLSREILKSFVKTVRYELSIPEPLGFHARPSTYISLIVRKHDSDVFLIVDGQKFNAKSVMSLLQAGGAIADKGYRSVVFEGDQRALDDIRTLSEHNYCEEESIPDSLSYLRDLQKSMH
ncbi:HPr family phosphocarrier protein [Nitrospina sp. 32_T5]|uniref:HPr family phosphocarrier protein n=1 Tax=unclassified Nitrospina TaxID=2638683 RepID=UPI003F949BB9